MSARWPFVLLRNPRDTSCFGECSGHVESRHRTIAGAVKAQAAINRACKRANGANTWIPLAIVRVEWDVDIGRAYIADRVPLDDLTDAWDDYQDSRQR